MSMKVNPPPLSEETRVVLDTPDAAYHFNRKDQCLRRWACKGGPVTPVRINGRLAWPVADIKRVLGVA